MRFTVDMFQNKVPHFLDLELSPDGISIFRKDTNAGLYVNFTNFVPWTYRTSWIKALVTRASRTCATNKLSSEINIIKRFVSWNDFPKSVANYVINKTLNTPSNNEGPNINNAEKAMKLWSIFAFLIMVIKVFHYSNLAFVKSNLIAKKIIQLYLDCYMMSQN